METLLIVFLIINVVANIMISNENIKNREIIESFVKASDIYGNAYARMALKYNEVALAFNEMKSVSNSQAEVLTAILASGIPISPAVQEALDRLAEARNAAKIPQDPLVQSTDRH